MTQTLKLADGLFADIDSGKKHATIRAGVRDINLGELTFEASSGSGVSRKVNVEWVSHTMMVDLTDEQAAADGYSCVEELWRELRIFYPNITGADWVTIVDFSVPGR